MRDDRERLRHIIEAIERTERYAVQRERAFRDDELIQNWMVRHLQVVGEAARGHSEGFLENHAEIQWRDIVGMRHVLVHDYFGIDLDIVWQVVERDLPDLKRKIEAILQDAG